MSAVRSDSRSPARYMAPPMARQPQRPLSLRQQRPAVRDDDEACEDLPWLTVYADEDEAGTDDELLMEAPSCSMQLPGPGLSRD